MVVSQKIVSIQGVHCRLKGLFSLVHELYAKQFISSTSEVLMIESSGGSMATITNSLPPAFCSSVKFHNEYMNG